jgi:hypothetical protein
MSNWANKSIYDKIYDRWTEKDNDYAKINCVRDAITSFFRSDEIIDFDERGNLVGECMYNGSGSWFSRMMATGFQGSLLSKNIPWIRYRMGQFELRGIDELDIWLQEIKDYMSDVYQRSNFYDVQPQFTHDGVTNGSPVMFGEEDLVTGKIMWKPQHYKNVRMYYDKNNIAEGIIVRDKTWTAKQILDTFVGDDDAEGTRRKEILSVEVNNAIDQGLLDQVFTVYRATFKYNDPIWDSEGEDAFKKPVGGWDWLSAYFLELSIADGKKKNKPLNKNMGDFSQPFTVWDFDKKPWESASRTPAWYAMFDNLSLQQIEKNYLEDIQNTNRRAFVALDTMKDRVDLSPEGEMYVTDAEYDKPPKLIERNGGLQFSRELIDMKEEDLKRWFYFDMFAMFSNLATNKNQPVTATQIWQMAGEKATLLSPAIETHSKYLEIADARMIDIEARAGRGPFSPQRMAEITEIVLNNMEVPPEEVGVQPVFVGQLAQAQKASQVLRPIQDSMVAMEPLMERNPQLRHMFRWYGTANEALEALDFAQKNIVPEEEYNAIVQAENEAAAEMQQQQMAIEAAKATPSVSGPVDENSILAKAAG